MRIYYSIYTLLFTRESSDSEDEDDNINNDYSSPQKNAPYSIGKKKGNNNNQKKKRGRGPSQP